MPGADEQELATPILSLCHGIFTDWSIFSTPFLLWKKGSSAPVTHWRQLVSCDWLWHFHGSLIQSRFDLKVNRSMKTPWQKYSRVACSSSYAAGNAHIRSHPLHKQQGLIGLLQGGKLWFYLSNGEGLEPIMLLWKCHSGHIMERCDECNNCTKFYTEKAFRDIPFFVISHHFLSMFHITSCDVTSHLICINQNLE